VTDDPNKNKLTHTGGDKLSTNGQKAGIKKPLWQRAADADKKQMAQRAVDEVADVSRENRIALLLDNSGSMIDHVSNGKSKIDYLREAVDTFVSQVDLMSTAVAIETFPRNVSESLTSDKQALMMASSRLNAAGGTPMDSAMENILQSQPITRALLISDGQADYAGRTETQATNYAEAGIPIDCIHIGVGSCGEELLKTVAERTKGIYVKFKDVASFAKAITYLTPKYRGMLTNGTVDAKQIGADEIKYLGGK
jgi:hypothetical protein